MDHTNERSISRRDVTLLELVDRILDKGVVLSGDITLSVAGVDLVYIGLRALLASAETADAMRSQAALLSSNRSYLGPGEEDER